MELFLQSAEIAGGLPASYVVPPGAAFRLESVSAVFNAAGAASAFYPCLAVYSQDGRLIGRFRPGAALAVGDTAEVSFAPFLGGDSEQSIVPLPTLRAFADLGADVSIVSTNQAVPTDILSVPAVTFTGVETVEIVSSCEFDCDMRGNPVAGSGGFLAIDLWEDSTNLGTIIDLSVSGIYQALGTTKSTRIVPTAGSHAYSLKGWRGHGVGVGNPTCFVYSSPIVGGAGLGSSLAIVG